MKKVRTGSVMLGAACGLVAALPAVASAQSFLLRPPEAPPPKGYALRETPGGGYAYEEDGWRVAIAPDGTVEFHDRTAVVTNLHIGPISFGRGGTLARPSLDGVIRDVLRKRPPPDPW